MVFERVKSGWRIVVKVDRSLDEIWGSGKRVKGKGFGVGGYERLEILKMNALVFPIPPIPIFSH